MKHKHLLTLSGLSAAVALTLAAGSAYAVNKEFATMVQAPNYLTNCTGTNCMNSTDLSDFEKRLDVLKSSGVEEVMVPMWWAKVETSSNNFNWGAIQTVAEKVEAAGLKWIPMFNFHRCEADMECVKGSSSATIELPGHIYAGAPWEEVFMENQTGAQLNKPGGDAQYYRGYFSFWWNGYGSTSCPGTNSWNCGGSSDLTNNNAYAKYARVFDSFGAHFNSSNSVKDDISRIWISGGPRGEVRLPYDGWSNMPTFGHTVWHSDAAKRTLSAFMKNAWHYWLYDGDDEACSGGHCGMGLSGFRTSILNAAEPKINPGIVNEWAFSGDYENHDDASIGYDSWDRPPFGPSGQSQIDSYDDLRCYADSDWANQSAQRDDNWVTDCNLFATWSLRDHVSKLLSAAGTEIGEYEPMMTIPVEDVGSCHDWSRESGYPVCSGNPHRHYGELRAGFYRNINTNAGVPEGYKVLVGQINKMGGQAIIKGVNKTDDYSAGVYSAAGWLVRDLLNLTHDMPLTADAYLVAQTDSNILTDADAVEDANKMTFSYETVGFIPNEDINDLVDMNAGSAVTTGSLNELQNNFADFISPVSNTANYLTTTINMYVANPQFAGGHVFLTGGSLDIDRHKTDSTRIGIQHTGIEGGNVSGFDRFVYWREGDHFLNWGLGIKEIFQNATNSANLEALGTVMDKVDNNNYTLTMKVDCNDADYNSGSGVYEVALRAYQVDLSGIDLDAVDGGGGTASTASLDERFLNRAVSDTDHFANEVYAQGAPTIITCGGTHNLTF